MSMQKIDYQKLVETSADAIVVCDTKGEIVVWNGAATRIFGFEKEEALGQSLDIIIPMKQRARHWEGYHATMASGVTKYGATTLRVPAVHKDGHILSIAFTVSLLCDEEAKPCQIVAIVRDETKNFEELRTLKKRVTELTSALESKT